MRQFLSQRGREPSGLDRKEVMERTGEERIGLERKGLAVVERYIYIAMNHTHLILDVSCLAYRALHTVGQLTYEGMDTGVLFGVFREFKLLRERFSPTTTTFCFDGRRLERKKIYSEYKEGRKKESTPEQDDARQGLYSQLELMRDELLPEIGFRNVFHRDGYEADDLIAEVCIGMPKKHTAIIISTDNDLWQLLVDGRVMIYSPTLKALFTAKLFRDMWGIDPFLWSDVKALAGCTSDNVKGIKGVGPHKATKFLCGKMKDGEVAFGAIIEGNDVYNRNLELVRLPFAGTPKCKLRKDQFDERAWDKVMGQFGMVSLAYRRVR